MPHWAVVWPRRSLGLYIPHHHLVVKAAELQGEAMFRAMEPASLGIVLKAEVVGEGR